MRDGQVEYINHVQYVAAADVLDQFGGQVQDGRFVLQLFRWLLNARHRCSLRVTKITLDEFGETKPHNKPGYDRC